ncbi:MAG: hypothetical protein IJT48_02865 [Bacteroidaceae bacterium]|nr:hypothetical protein [Bacteroidaceae bacterium]
MDFDICVFSRDKAPREPNAFLAWFDKQVERYFRDSDNDCDDISVCTPDMQHWYMQMLSHFPALGGRDSLSSQEAFIQTLGDVDEDEAEARVDEVLVNYVIAPDLIYIMGNWDLVDRLYALSREAAFECGLGFYDFLFNRVYFSETETMLMPDTDDGRVQYVTACILPSIEEAQECIAKRREQLCDEMQRYSAEPQYRRMKSPWLRWFYNEEAVFASREDMWKIVGTLLAILVVSGGIVYLSPIEYVWATAMCIMMGALIFLLIALVASLYHYYKTGHFLSE